MKRDDLEHYIIDNMPQVIFVFLNRVIASIII